MAKPPRNFWNGSDPFANPEHPNPFKRHAARPNSVKPSEEELRLINQISSELSYSIMLPLMQHFDVASERELDPKEAAIIKLSLLKALAMSTVLSAKFDDVHPKTFWRRNLETSLGLIEAHIDDQYLMWRGAQDLVEDLKSRGIIKDVKGG